MRVSTDETGFEIWYDQHGNRIPAEAVQRWEKAEEAVTLRDQFAIAALQGMLACPDPQTMGMGYHKEYSEAAYQYADAMLEARKEDAGV